MERLQALFADRVLQRVRVRGPSLMRTADPPLSAAFGRRVLEVSRLGKRIVIRLEGELHLVLHLMIAGRLHMKPAGCTIPGKLGMAAFDFEHASLLLTEAGSHKRAQLSLLADRGELAAHDRGGPAASCSPIAGSRGCSNRTGPRRSPISKNTWPRASPRRSSGRYSATGLRVMRAISSAARDVSTTIVSSAVRRSS